MPYCKKFLIKCVAGNIFYIFRQPWIKGCLWAMQWIELLTLRFPASYHDHSPMATPFILLLLFLVS